MTCLDAYSRGVNYLRKRVGSGRTAIAKTAGRCGVRGREIRAQRGWPQEEGPQNMCFCETNPNCLTYQTAFIHQNYKGLCDDERRDNSGSFSEAESILPQNHVAACLAAGVPIRLPLRLRFGWGFGKNVCVRLLRAVSNKPTQT
jgi:hypothetical protein